MPDARLVIGNKNYSSWSLRAWLMARHAGLDFEEEIVVLGQPDTRRRILERSPSGRVPCLVHEGHVVWETLSIGEYLAESFPDRRLWPVDLDARIHARNVCSEMHAGFATLRTALPMNARANLPGKGRDRGDARLLERDIGRITAIWSEARERFGSRTARDEGYLYGTFTIADAMYAPVVLRFQTYAVALAGAAATYFEVMTGHPPLVEWVEAARGEPYVMEDKDL